MSRTLYVRTLSPVFIGAGAELQPFEYVVADAKLYRLNSDKVFSLILDRSEDAAERFERWLSDKTHQVERERDNQRLSELMRNFTLVQFVRTELRDDQLARHIERNLSELALYVLPCPSLDGLKLTGRSPRAQRKKTIATAIKTGTQQLYIPGSSLKGLFRTALLFTVLTEADAQFINTIVRKIQFKLAALGTSPRDQDKKFFDDVLEMEVFFCGVTEKGRTTFDDARFDLMKLISISDSTTLEPAQAGCVIPIDTYQANGQVQPQTPAVEAIAAGNVVQMRIGVDTTAIEHLRQWVASRAGGVGNSLWIGLAERFRRLFGCSLEQATEERILDRLMQAAQQFGTAVAQHDRMWAQTYPGMENFLDHLPELSLKIGWGSGFHATTVMLAMLKNPALLQIEQDVFARFQLGRAPRQQRAGNERRTPVELSNLPRSRRLHTPAITSMPNPQPIGWIELAWEPLQPDAVRPFVTAEHHRPPVPAEPPIATTLRHGAEVCARVVDPRTKPITVELLAVGHEGKRYPCTGISNTTGLEISTIIRVRVNLHPKTKQVQSLTYQGIWRSQ